MIIRKPGPLPFEELRQQAEDLLRKQDIPLPEDRCPDFSADLERTLHELRVHQIELEMQNEELRRAQADLDLSRARYFELYDLAPVGYLTLSHRALIQEANLTASTILGVPRSTLSNLPFSHFILFDDHGIWYRHLKTLQEKREPQTFDLRMLRQDGQIFWAHLQAIAEKDTGNTAGFRLVFGDITANKAAEKLLQREHASLERLQTAQTIELQQTTEALQKEVAERLRVADGLRESEAKLSTVMAGVPALLTFCDADLRYVFVNKAYADWYARTPAEIQGMRIVDLLGEETFQRALPNYHLALSGQEVFFENRTVDKVGKERYVSVRLVPHFHEGQVAGFFGAVTDITERKRAEEALMQSEAKFRSMFDHSPVGSVLAGTDNRFIKCNAAFCKFLGYSEAELIGKTITEVTLPEDREVGMPEMKQLLDGKGESCIVEKRYRRKDGDIVWGEVSISLVRNANGQPRFFLPVIQDITRRKLEEERKEKLEAQNRQLQKSESLGRMAAAIAHHFNNQLGAVIGYLEMALTEPAKEESPAGWLTSARKAADRAAEVSSLMLTYLGQSVTRHELLDLAELCQRQLAQLTASLPENVKLVSDVPENGPVIKADALQIRQILNNLVTNAWEASSGKPNDLRVSIKSSFLADIPPSRHFPVDAQLQQDVYACLEVSDTGCGIPEMDIEKLFDPFFSSKFTGRGMGLAVVLGIVRAHDGFITVETKLNHGSTFRVYLPQSAETLRKPPEKNIVPTGMKWSGTALLVEDNELLRFTTEFLLTRQGFKVLTAGDGVEAVEVFRQHAEEIRLVLCDLTMPRMDGWETLTALRQLKPGLPVILSSGYSESQALEGKHAELPQAFLNKPYDVQQLAEKIQQALEHETPRTS